MTLQPLCVARGLTLEDLAEQAGVASATVIKIDQGTLRPNQAVLRRLAAALGMEAVTLQGELSNARRRQKIASPSGTQWR